MGQFKIEITAVGGHGCSRETKDGEQVYGCNSMSCPDCQARELVLALQRWGCSVEEAKLTHWPGQPGQVVDDLITRKRTGSF